MSAFEVKITPTRLKPVNKTASREPTKVVFAPFSAKAVIAFEDVPVNKTARRLLYLENPSDEDIKVTVTKNVRPEYNADLQWTTSIIKANDQVEMEIVWTPPKVFTCKETLQFTDSRNFKKDVVLIFKSVGKKVDLKNKKRTDSSLLPNRNTRVVNKLPAHSKKNNKSPVQSQHISKRRSEIYNINTKYNRIEETTLAPEKKNENFDKHTRRDEDILLIHNYGKENLSPNSPGAKCYDNENVTPSPTIKSECQNNIEYLASLPTPLNDFEVDGKSINKSEYNLQPKQLYKFLLSEDSNKDEDKFDVIIETELFAYTEKREVLEVLELPDVKDSPIDRDAWGSAQSVVEDKIQINNKTFDLKTKLHEINNDTNSVYSPKNNSVELVIHTEYNQNNLLTIKEEDCDQIIPLTGNKLGATFNIRKSNEKCEDQETDELKRDIKLISTPLQKYSESLKDLSMRSPRSRSAYCKLGSLPNLAEIECIDPIDENRYYHKQEIDNCNDISKCSTTSTVSVANMPDIVFNQNEILAQSSRLNINENTKKITPKRNLKNSQTPSPKELNKRVREISGDSGTTSELQVEQPESMTISPPKRTKFDDKEFSTRTPLKSDRRVSVARGSLNNWTRTKPKTLKIEKTLSTMKKSATPRKTKPDQRVKLYNTELYLRCCINPDPFAATTTCDPFLTATMYLDERSVNSHEAQFKRWLNALVSIPAEFDSDCNQKIDVGRLFSEVRNKDVALAPTKEEQSMNYLTKSRMNSLRSAAVNLFMSEEMREPCSKVAVCINKELIKIRADRDLHLDVVMQRYILELLLCFNPLWLRIGLEAVFGEIIYMHSNADIVGLSTFILNRLFRDKFIEQKYTRAYVLSDEYSAYIKKFTLQKMLFLLLFLDKAKNKRIIKHNPCLFVKKSQYKETKEILLRFSSELLANIGDVTRSLRRFGYFLTHKQTFLDEFDYGFTNLAVDLRDGIRLTRIMEIILLRDNLTQQLRVPAISRLQRIFNVNLALKALAEADFTLTGDIFAADIVDGHREKTLSLLWQIIYKFRSPKFNASATTLQRWWRKSWLKVVIKRRIIYKREMRRLHAAILIQSYYRSYITRKYVEIYKKACIKSAIILQKHIRRYLAQKKLHNSIVSAIRIQRWYRSMKITIQTKIEYIEIKRSVIVIQRWYRTRILVRKLEKASVVIREFKIHAKVQYEKAVIIQRCLKSYTIRRKFHSLVYQTIQYHRYNVVQQTSAVKIQSFLKMSFARQRFLVVKRAVVTIQQKWRAYKLRNLVRYKYLVQRRSVVTIQNFYRSYRKMKYDRTQYIALRTKTILIQRRYREIQLTRKLRQDYLKTYNKIVVLQQRLRATLIMKHTRLEYLRLRASIIRVQQRFRATKEMRLQFAEYKKLKYSSILIQKHYRAYKERSRYVLLKSSVIKIQQKLRATLLARKKRIEFLTLQYHSILIQQKYRANRLMQKQVAEYLTLKHTVITIQRRFRAKKLMKKCVESYQTLRKATIIIQQKFKSYLKMRIERARYMGTRQAIICIQQRFRACVEMKRCCSSYLAQKRAAITIQQHFRAYLVMKDCRQQYLRKHSAILILQQRFRSYRKFKSERQEYLQKRYCAILIQRRYRANRLMRIEHRKFTEIKRATILIQNRFRALRNMRKVWKEFQVLRTATIVIQTRFRAQQKMKKARMEYIKLLNAVRCIQMRFKAKISMKVLHTEYKQLKVVTIFIQRRFRALKEGRKMKSQFLNMKSAAICIQRHYRAIKAMKNELTLYNERKSSVITIQRHFKAYVLMKRERTNFLLLKSSTIVIQQQFRAILEMRRQRCIYLKTVKQIRYIQTLIRATIQMRIERKQYLVLKHTVIKIQQKYRLILHMRQERYRYLKIKRSAIIIQRRYRAYREMCKCRSEYLRISQATIILQRKFRANLQMRIERYKFLQLRKVTIFIQQKYRAKLQCKKQQKIYNNVKRTVIGLQAHIRGNLARKRFAIMMSPEMLEHIKRQRAARLIQSFWRGYLVRKTFLSWKLKTIRANIKHLRNTAKYSNTVKYKLCASIQFLKDRYNVQEAYFYVKSLERTSRTIPHVLVEHAKFIASVCYAIMAQAIRSEADKHIIEICSRIILNLARFGPTTSAAFQENGFTTVAQMLLRWCDKECGIFNTLCTLIWVFSHSKQKRNKIREFVTSTEAIFMLRETKKLVIRKEKMRQNVRKTASTAQSQTNSSPTMRKSLPILEPDFGVVKRKPYTFVCSVFALDTVLAKLEVDI